MAYLEPKKADHDQLEREHGKEDLPRHLPPDLAEHTAGDQMPVHTCPAVAGQHLLTDYAKTGQSVRLACSWGMHASIGRMLYVA